MGRKPKLWKHPNGQWATSAGGRHVYFGANKKLAQQRFQAHLESLKLPCVEALRVDDLGAKFIASLESDPATIAQKKWAIERWCCWRIGNTPNGARLATDVSKADLRAFRKSLADDYDVTSINHIVGAVKMCWKWAVEEDPPILLHNPMAGIKKLAEPPREPEYLSRGQVAMLIREARKDHGFYRKVNKVERRPSESLYRRFATMIRFSYKTGMRVGELCKLTWEMVDLELGQLRMQVHKTAKRTGRLRVVTLTAAAQRILLKFSHRTGHVFLNGLGEPFKARNVPRRFRRLRERLNLPEKFRLTSFRHTYISDHLRARESSKMVADLVGHADTKMVERVYGHLLDEDHREAVGRLDAFRRGLAKKASQRKKEQAPHMS
jgi:integrase